MYVKPKQKRGKRHSKGMQIADNPLSRNFARIFAERENGIMQTKEDGLPLVRDNEEFRSRLKEIRDKILEKHDLSKEAKEPFCAMTVLGWIRPNPKNKKFPLRDPNLRYLSMFCEAIGKEPWEMYLEPGQIHLNRLPQEVQDVLQKAASMSGNKKLFESIKNIIDMYEDMLIEARSKNRKVNSNHD